MKRLIVFTILALLAHSVVAQNHVHGTKVKSTSATYNPQFAPHPVYTPMPVMDPITKPGYFTAMNTGGHRGRRY